MRLNINKKMNGCILLYCFFLIFTVVPVNYSGSEDISGSDKMFSWFSQANAETSSSEEKEKPQYYRMPPRDTGTYPEKSDEEFLRKLHAQLGGEPEKSGLYRQQLKALKDGVPRERIVSEFYESREYRERAAKIARANELAPPRDMNTHPEMSDEEFIEYLYRNILGRKSDPDGYRAHLEALKNGGQTREQQIESFYNSEEYINRLLAGDNEEEEKDMEKEEGEEEPMDKENENMKGTGNIKKRRPRPEVGPDGKVIISPVDIEFFKSRFVRLKESFWKKGIAGTGANLIKNVVDSIENAPKKKAD